jgi:hypothetical protein
MSIGSDPTLSSDSTLGSDLYFALAFISLWLDGINSETVPLNSAFDKTDST